jgi:hypothetical protein
VNAFNEFFLVSWICGRLRFAWKTEVCIEIMRIEVSWREEFKQRKNEALNRLVSV